MLIIDKLSEKNLYDVLMVLFPTVDSIKKETFVYRGKRMIVDYYFELNGKRFAIEFDGPTHYTRTKTQIRDINLSKYCDDNDITLVRIPYFIQIDDQVLSCLFGHQFCMNNNMYEKITSRYQHGFIDKECVLPADFNPYGQQLFLKNYWFYIKGDNDAWSVLKSIYNNAMLRNKDEFIGVSPSEDLIIFWENYPT